MERLDYHIARFERCEAIDLREWKNFVIFEFKRSIVSVVCFFGIFGIPKYLLFDQCCNANAKFLNLNFLFSNLNLRDCLIFQNVCQYFLFVGTFYLSYSKNRDYLFLNDIFAPCSKLTIWRILIFIYLIEPIIFLNIN